MCLASGLLFLNEVCSCAHVQFFLASFKVTSQVLIYNLQQFSPNMREAILYETRDTLHCHCEAVYVGVRKQRVALHVDASRGA